ALNRFLSSTSSITCSLSRFDSTFVVTYTEIINSPAPRLHFTLFAAQLFPGHPFSFGSPSPSVKRVNYRLSGTGIIVEFLIFSDRLGKASSLFIDPRESPARAHVARLQIDRGPCFCNRLLVLSFTKQAPRHIIHKRGISW